MSRNVIINMCVEAKFRVVFLHIPILIAVSINFLADNLNKFASFLFAYVSKLKLSFCKVMYLLSIVNFYLSKAGRREEPNLAGRYSGV